MRAAAYLCGAAAGCVLILVVVVAIAITTDRLGGGALYFAGLVAAHLVCQPIGRQVVVRSWVGFKRNISADGWSALAADARPPVLYLRSFLVDELLARTGETGVDYFRTEEERFARAFSRIGPLVAIGRPGEPLPPAGAPRVYVGDDWQQTVRELLHRSRLVLIGAGRGEGLRWELELVTVTVDPRRVVVLLPFGNWEYDHFRSEVAGLFPHPLPDLAPLPDADDHTVRAALHFREDWTAELVRLSTDRGTSLEMALLQQLAPVFAHLDDARAPARLRRQRDLRWLALSLAGLVLLLSAVWGLLRVFVLR
ncbi:hypothetical protein BBK82_37580 [Lentzea guizhouensis]|uniref:Transferase n=1 Tax=Lentzea guizhouensis TaxID=1586287 RepID=A0A1B2HT28_9PSEU|nr:hypothetical protein BBK82_37580 [Lentzea guizhouensis]